MSEINKCIEKICDNYNEFTKEELKKSLDELVIIIECTIMNISLQELKSDKFKDKVIEIFNSRQNGYNKVLTFIELSKKQMGWINIDIIPSEYFYEFWKFVENPKFRIMLNDDCNKFRILKENTD